MKVLLIDADPRVQRRLKRVLQPDYVMDSASTAEEAEKLAYTTPYDVILMETILPDMNGEDLCMLLKSRLENIPIIIISASGEVSDKERAFQNGADDYLVKPVNTRELRARMSVSVRNGGRPIVNPVLKLRKLKLDTRRRIVTYKGERIKLRKKEMLLLEFFLLNKGRVVTRLEILENVWDMNANPFTNTVEVHIKRLRDNIEVPFNEKYIETIHGIGYLME